MYGVGEYLVYVGVAPLVALRGQQTFPVELRCYKGASSPCDIFFENPSGYLGLRLVNAKAVVFSPPVAYDKVMAVGDFVLVSLARPPFDVLGNIW